MPNRARVFDFAPSWEELARYLSDVYGVPVDEFAIAYEDGDSYTLMNSEEELNEYFQYLPETQSDVNLKLIVTRFTAGCRVEPTTFADVFVDSLREIPSTPPPNTRTPPLTPPCDAPTSAVQNDATPEIFRSLLENEGEHHHVPASLDLEAQTPQSPSVQSQSARIPSPPSPENRTLHTPPTNSSAPSQGSSDTLDPVRTDLPENEDNIVSMFPDGVSEHSGSPGAAIRDEMSPPGSDGGTDSSYSASRSEGMPTRSSWQSEYSAINVPPPPPRSRCIVRRVETKTTKTVKEFREFLQY
ncbi:hypothetical protein M422DRAFT_29317 [Sphaerobolus stellatus SS14]|nr:hypothetical protein M422DRAFT_29317 [Sphaerobolus stellatus SS14]